MVSWCQHRDNNVISCGKLTIISCQLQCIIAGFGKLRASHCLGRVAEGYLSRAAELFPTVSYRSIGLAIIRGRSIQGHSICGKGDCLVRTRICNGCHVHVIDRDGRAKGTMAGNGETYEDTAPHRDASTSTRSPGDAITGIIAGQAIARSRQFKPVRNDKLRPRRGGVGRGAVGFRSALEDDLV
jgi:hypothetical protein